MTMMKYTTREDKVREFHKAFGLAIGVEGAHHNLTMRDRLIGEEAEEVADAIRDIQIDLVYGKPAKPEAWAHLLKELADLQYVISGTLVAIKELAKVDFDVVFNRVHDSNMSKLDNNGMPIYNERGKVMKGPNYKEPDLSDLV
jgi:NTP pyrophosphatase (non-canonical NTP hydrolase)